MCLIRYIGAGESGKSTVLKQMKLIHASGFDENERESFRLIVFTNIVVTMQLLTEAIDQLNIPLEHESYRVKYLGKFINVDPLFFHPFIHTFLLYRNIFPYLNV